MFLLAERLFHCQQALNYTLGLDKVSEMMCEVAPARKHFWDAILGDSLGILFVVAGP